ncbi:MAG: hypothetical protein EZS28_048184 [Streblomastix strix]|uniref:Uncharacterized protein n=1 Tax=Streblomastix strix TaxID=222440 RepID=A0A5J4TDU9_9EUKA|nr:MAG: hypothetical protein EZS28_048184 [Streblomastix strix]
MMALLLPIPKAKSNEKKLKIAKMLESFVKDLLKNYQQFDVPIQFDYSMKLKFCQELKDQVGNCQTDLQKELLKVAGIIAELGFEMTANGQYNEFLKPFAHAKFLKTIIEIAQQRMEKEKLQ